MAAHTNEATICTVSTPFHKRLLYYNYQLTRALNPGHETPWIIVNNPEIHISRQRIRQLLDERGKAHNEKTYRRTLYEEQRRYHDPMKMHQYIGGERILGGLSLADVMARLPQTSQVEGETQQAFDYRKDKTLQSYHHAYNLELALSKLDAARAVYELEDRFFATSIDMLCFLNFNGHFKRLNPAWERTLGFTREELMSRPFIEFVHPDDRERTLNQNREVRGGGKALGFENRYLCKDGSYRWFLWNAAPDTAEQLIYSVARDVTASKLATEEREQLVRELQSALDEVKALRGILPMCSYCRRVRDDNDYWHTVENYISTHTTTLFTHGICPSCVATEIEPQLSS